MPADPPKPPVFGPNGAVMNAPRMTDEMRAKIEASAAPPVAQNLPEKLGRISIAVNVAVACAMGGALLLHEREPAVAIGLGVCGAGVAVGWAAWRFFALRRAGAGK